MWIRSQDKTVLVKASCLYIYESPYMSYYFCIKERDVDLGIYSSREKALKVLDMIEKNIDVINIYPPFKMPQDREV